MADLDQVRALVAGDSGLAVVSTARRDGSIRSSVVNAGVLDHPASGAAVVGFVANGGTAKLADLRRVPRATLVLRVGWQWTAAEGAVDLIGPDDRFDGIDDDRLRILLRDVFHSAGGSHDDLAAYDAVMAEQRRCVVLVHTERLYGVSPG